MPPWVSSLYYLLTSTFKKRKRSLHGTYTLLIQYLCTDQILLSNLSNIAPKYSSLYALQSQNYSPISMSQHCSPGLRTIFYMGSYGVVIKKWVTNKEGKVYLWVLFTNPSARAGYDTRSIFKQSLTGLNSEFSFS